MGTHSKHLKSLFRPNNICLWVVFGWQSASFPPLFAFMAAPKQAGTGCNNCLHNTF